MSNMSVKVVFERHTGVMLGGGSKGTKRPPNHQRRQGTKLYLPVTVLAERVQPVERLALVTIWTIEWEQR